MSTRIIFISGTKYESKAIAKQELISNNGGARRSTSFAETTVRGIVISHATQLHRRMWKGDEPTSRVYLTCRCVETFGCVRLRRRASRAVRT